MSKLTLEDLRREYEGAYDRAFYRGDRSITTHEACANAGWAAVVERLGDYLWKSGHGWSATELRDIISEGPKPGPDIEGAIRALREGLRGDKQMHDGIERALDALEGKR